MCLLQKGQHDIRAILSPSRKGQQTNVGKCDYTQDNVGMMGNQAKMSRILGIVHFVSTYYPPKILMESLFQDLGVLEEQFPKPLQQMFAQFVAQTPSGTGVFVN